MSKRAAAVEPLPPEPPEATYRDLPLGALAESLTNPRRVVEDAAFAELVASVRAHGVIEPLVVRKVMEGWEVVAGHRRFRAAQAAGLYEIPVMERDLTDRQVLELQLAENVHRASMTPLEEARALQRLADLDGAYRDPRTLAGKIGRSETYVRDRLRLLRLIPDAQSALDAGALTATHAERIARLPADQQSAALEHCFSPFLLADAGADTIRAAIDGGRWQALALALMSVADLDRYLAAHATIDVTAPEIQQVLRPQLEELFPDRDASEDPDDEERADADVAYRAQTEELPRLSTDYALRPAEAKTLDVLPFGKWKRVTADDLSKGCGAWQTGIVVHGELEDGSPRTAPELVTFCAQRGCPVHWPQEKPQQAPGRDRAVPDWKREQEKREAARKQWEADLARVAPLVAEHTKTAKLTAKLVAHVFGDHQATEVAKTYGVQLNDRTAAQVMALAGLDDWSREAFVKSAKRIGFDAKAALAKLAREKSPKAAKSKKGGRR
jgi:ParB family chromosome partitioning protein